MSRLPRPAPRPASRSFQFRIALNAEGVGALRLPAPERPDREHHDVALAEGESTQRARLARDWPLTSVPDSSMSFGFAGNCMTTRGAVRRRCPEAAAPATRAAAEPFLHRRDVARCRDAAPDPPSVAAPCSGSYGREPLPAAPALGVTFWPTPRDFAARRRGRRSRRARRPPASAAPAILVEVDRQVGARVAVRRSGSSCR